MLIYGHRGASAVEPENTLRAFAKALELGVDGLEFDVHVTADRVPVILHDRDLARTTNLAGPIDRLTLAELGNADAGLGERVPTLAEVLALVGDRVHLDIEIKQGGIESEVLAVLRAFPQVRWSISSFDWTSLERFRALDAEADLWVLAVSVSEAVLNVAARQRASAVALYDRSFDVESARQLTEAGLEAMIWTVNDPDRANALKDLGAMALCTDDPGAMMQALGT